MSMSTSSTARYQRHRSVSLSGIHGVPFEFSRVTMSYIRIEKRACAL